MRAHKAAFLALAVPWAAVLPYPWRQLNGSVSLGYSLKESWCRKSPTLHSLPTPKTGPRTRPLLDVSQDSNKKPEHVLTPLQAGPQFPRTNTMLKELHQQLLCVTCSFKNHHTVLYPSAAAYLLFPPSLSKEDTTKPHLLTHLYGASAIAFVNIMANSPSSSHVSKKLTWTGLLSCSSTKACKHQWKQQWNN